MKSLLRTKTSIAAVLGGRPRRRGRRARGRQAPRLAAGRGRTLGPVPASNRPGGGYGLGYGGFWVVAARASAARSRAATSGRSRSGPRRLPPATSA